VVSTVIANEPIIFQQDDWTVIRRIGVGDREHVRAGLLQVALLSWGREHDKVTACLNAAKRLVKTLRIYVNCKRMKQVEVEKLVRITMAQFRDHDLMEENSISEKQFQFILDRCDILVIGGSPASDPKVLQDLVTKAWNYSEGREYLDGAARHLSYSAAKEKFPELFQNEETYWQLWSSWSDVSGDGIMMQNPHH
jgi:hypothetical protein